MGKKPFQFKQFTVGQDRCAMKIGTDGVLLGAWATLGHHPSSILDIGAGTGIIALMLAQRSDAELIDAMEIDDNAFEQCVENFENSPWGDRLFCYHAGFQEFVDEIDEQYDLIVSNPPFYSETVSSGKTSRDTARMNRSLPFDELLSGSAKLLSDTGFFCLILPFIAEKEVLEIAKQYQLFPAKITHVKGHPEAEVKRSLIALSKQPLQTITNELVIETERHVYTQDYVNLTKDFYLKM